MLTDSVRRRTLLLVMVAWPLGAIALAIIGSLVADWIAILILPWSYLVLRLVLGTRCPNCATRLLAGGAFRAHWWDLLSMKHCPNCRSQV